MKDTNTTPHRSEALRLSIAASVDELRALEDWTYRQLARKAGLSPQTVFSLMKGLVDCRLSTLEALAVALECNLQITFTPRRLHSRIQQRGIARPPSSVKGERNPSQIRPHLDMRDGDLQASCAEMLTAINEYGKARQERQSTACRHLA